MQCNYVPEMVSSKIKKNEAKIRQDKSLSNSGTNHGGKVMKLIVKFICYITLVFVILLSERTEKYCRSCLVV